LGDAAVAIIARERILFAVGLSAHPPRDRHPLNRNRVLHGLAQELELPKLTFQVIRRTIATLAQKKGTVKDIQGVLRHSRTATTTDVYMQEIPESVQKTVDAISAELRLLPNLEEVTGGTSVLLPNATKLKSGVSASS